MAGMDDKLGEMPSLRPGGKTGTSGIGIRGSDSGMNNFEMTIICHTLILTIAYGDVCVILVCVSYI